MEMLEYFCHYVGVDKEGVKWKGSSGTTVDHFNVMIQCTRTPVIPRIKIHIAPQCYDCAS